MNVARPNRESRPEALDRGSSAVPTRRSRRRDDETGAMLILALVFVVVISVITGTLTTWATNALNDTGKFNAALSFESAANSAVELALQNVRYNFATQTLNAVPPQPCWTTSPAVSQVTLNNQTVSVWCSTAWSPLSSNTRVVTFSACVSNFVGSPSLAAMNGAATSCAANPLLQSVISFDDFPSTISASNCPPGSGGSTSTCGTRLAVQSWAFNVTSPTVTSITCGSFTQCSKNPTLAPCVSPQELVTVSGTSLNGATAVNFFVPQASNNAIFSASPVTSSTASVTVCGPSGLSAGTTYQVTVTTPAGTSVPSTYVAGTGPSSSLPY